MNHTITRKFHRQYLPEILLYLGVAALMLQCKSPFATRTPEPPVNQQRTNWKQPTKPSDVLENLRYAIQDKNLTNFLNCFADSAKNGRHFGYQPDHTARIRYPGIWEQWNLKQEEAAITNIFHAVPNDSIIALIYLGDSVENPFADSTIIIREYELVLSHNRNPLQYPRLAKGRAEFHLGLNPEGYWAIFFWIDDSFENTPSWSDVKATFAP